MPDTDLSFGQAPSIRTPHPGPRSMAVLERIRRMEATSALTFGLSDSPPVLARAAGAVIEDPDGNLFLDMVAGFGSLNLGHSHPALVEAAALQLPLGQQAMSIASVVRTDLLEQMCEYVPGHRPILAASGSEAMEIALKLARRATGRAGVIAFAGGFHGRTLGALALMGRSSQRQDLGQLGNVVHLPFPDPETSPLGQDPDSIGRETLALIASQLDDPAGGWDQIGAVVIEPVQGNGGMKPAPRGFLRGLREICDEKDILLIADEVMSGFHRTGRRFAFEHEGIRPDVVVMGKSLSAGLPLAGCLVAPHVDRASTPNTESSTYAGNLVSCAAALAALRVYEEEGMSERAAGLGSHLRDALSDRLQSSPVVARIGGLGLMVGVDLAPGGRPAGMARRVTGEAIGRGLLLYAGGHRGETVCFLPPLTVTEAQLDVAVGVLGEVLDDLGPELTA